MEAIVEYNYVAQEPDELTIRKGDIITEIKVMLGGWWEGTLRDKRGMFPDNFVKLLESSSAGGTSGAGGSGEGPTNTKSEESSLRNGGSGRRFCKVLFRYEPCNEDELALVPQDSIEFLGEVEEGWWRGRLRGRIGVFPSNFVSPPVYEELCRVLFPYEAANDDELTLVEGDVITLLSRDAPDKGWWRGELRGQIGLFPDNFVEVITVRNEHQDQDQWYESTPQTSTKSITKHSHQTKKSEKAHVRKSLDVRNVHTDHFSTTEKKTSTSSSSTLSSSSPLASIVTGGSGGGGTGGGGGGGSGGGGGNDKKFDGNHSIISGLKRLVGDVGNNGNGSTNVALGEELDGVERGEGAPLSHLTASRAKAPRRRPPSSQHLRHHAAGSTVTFTTTTTLTSVSGTILEDNLANGSAETAIEQNREDEGDGLVAKTRKKAPWVEELKMNQLERRKINATERIDKLEVKKERNFSRLMTSTNVTDAVNKIDGESEEKQKEKEKEKNQRLDVSPNDHASGPPAFVPYYLYSQLLERVTTLEEKQAILQQTVGQLSEQLILLLANPSINSKV